MKTKNITLNTPIKDYEKQEIDAAIEKSNLLCDAPLDNIEFLTDALFALINRPDCMDNWIMNSALVIRNNLLFNIELLKRTAKRDALMLRAASC